jgi:hypothetical protein
VRKALGRKFLWLMSQLQRANLRREPGTEDRDLRRQEMHRAPRQRHLSQEQQKENRTWILPRPHSFRSILQWVWGCIKLEKRN